MSGLDSAPGKRAARAGREAGIDPLCHTLFGAALSQTGLGSRTAWGTTALIVGANLPDIDILSMLAGPLADLEWRRGWSHGVLALLVLPFLLTFSLILIYKLRRARGRPGTAPFRHGQVLLLTTIAVVSHPILDTLNTYGVRWLMPFSERWFYGDALFIIDPWAWLALAAGGAWSWHRRRRGTAGETGPAQWALAGFGVYATAMWVSSALARNVIASQLQEHSGLGVTTAMASPLPLTLVSRSFVAEQGDNYLVGTFRWLPRPTVSYAEIQRFPRTRPSHPAMAAALRRQEMRRFLGWARFPTFLIEPRGRSEYLVHAVDLRYTRRPGVSFGALTLAVRISAYHGVTGASEQERF
jgi:inner membrane protein